MSRINDCSDGVHDELPVVLVLRITQKFSLSHAARVYNPCSAAAASTEIVQTYLGAR